MSLRLALLTILTAAGVFAAVPPALVSSKKVSGTPASTLKDSQATDDAFNFWGTAAAQKVSSSYIAGSSYSLTSVKIKVAPQEGGETCSVSIFDAAEFEVATGAARGTSDSISTTSFPAFPGGLVEFTFGTPIAITSGRTNIIVMNHSNPDGSHRVYTKKTNTGSRYIWVYDGATWGSFANGQFVFEAYGY